MMICGAQCVFVHNSQHYLHVCTVYILVRISANICRCRRKCLCWVTTRPHGHLLPGTRAPIGRCLVNVSTPYISELLPVTRSVNSLLLNSFHKCELIIAELFPVTQILHRGIIWLFIINFICSPTVLTTYFKVYMGAGRSWVPFSDYLLNYPKHGSYDIITKLGH